MNDVPDPRTSWFAAAIDILSADGFGGLKLAPLCRRVGVSTGPFYYLFRSWQEFTDQLLEHWHRENTQDLIDLARAQQDAADQVQLLIDVAVALPHSAEGAIRAWATVDARVATVLRMVDAERLTIGRQAFAGLMDEEVAARCAGAGMNLLIGFQMTTSPRDPEQLRWSLEQLRLLAAGGPATSPTPAAGRRSAAAGAQRRREYGV